MADGALPPLSRRAATKAATRVAVVDSAGVLFARAGFLGVTMRDVARHAGMSTGAIFSHFAGKEALYAAATGKPAPTPATMDASQDLLAALRDVLPYAEACIGLPRSAWPSDSVILAAEAAIAKAEAGQ